MGSLVKQNDLLQTNACTDKLKIWRMNEGGIWELYRPDELEGQGQDLTAGEPFHSEYLLLLGARLRIWVTDEKHQYLILKTSRVFGNFDTKSPQKLEAWTARNSENRGAENWNWYLTHFLIKTFIKFRSYSEQEAEKSRRLLESRAGTAATQDVESWEGCDWCSAHPLIYKTTALSWTCQRPDIANKIILLPSKSGASKKSWR